MEKRYIYARLYDHCVDDDFKTSARIIRRKDRIPFGIFSYVMIIGSCLFLILNVSYQKLIGIFGIIAAMNIIYETRTGLISLFNYYKVRGIRNENYQNILEKFCVYHNQDGNYIKLQDRHMRRVLDHPFDWCIVSLLFLDEMNNKYIFRISLKELSLRIKLSKSFKKSHPTEGQNGLKLFTRYGLENLKDIDSVKDLTEFIREEYRRISFNLSDNS